MGYALSLYQKVFLEKALAEHLKDWTKADPIAEKIKDAFRAVLLGNGFEAITNNHYELRQKEISCQFFDGSIDFDIRVSKQTEQTIVWCTKLMVDFAEKNALVVYDTQDPSTDDLL